jgi:hypothetical protein
MSKILILNQYLTLESDMPDRIIIVKGITSEELINLINERNDDEDPDTEDYIVDFLKDKGIEIEEPEIVDYDPFDGAKKGETKNSNHYNWD